MNSKSDTQPFQWTDELVEELIWNAYGKPDVRFQINNFKSSYASSVGEKRDWEIVSVINPNGLVSEDWCVINNFITEDKRYLGYSIHSVRRLPSGEIFSVGDKVIHVDGSYKEVITGFAPSFNGAMFFYFEEEKIHVKDLKNFLKAPIQEPKPKKLFTTLDGKDILIGDEFWYLENWSARRGVANTLHAGAFPTYSTKEAAKEYIILNKPCLSISELKKFKGSNSRIIEVYVDDLMSIVKSKINHTGGDK